MLFFTVGEDGHPEKPDRDAKLDGLLLSVSKGDKGAFAELYAQINKDVYGFALSILRSPQEAEDTAHDTFLRIWQAAGSYKSTGKPMAWILTIVRNLALMRLRETGRISGTTAEEAMAFLADTRGLPTEDSQLLAASLELLSPEELQIVTLHAVSGFEHREIAAMLKLPDATVRTKYRRALKKLRTLMEEGSR
ncbi:MAG: RNA polymerase sigma factor [Oscillospiraceae bacterium]